MLKTLNLVLIVCAFSTLGIAQGTLNVSKDLTTLKIAAQNLTPNTPTLDAGPLLTQAIAYAQQNGIRTVTADRGDYYFLSLATNQTHFLVNNGANLTIDLQYSNLYFKQSHRGAVWCNNCTGVTFQNFTIDYMTLPFTQLTVTAVNAANRTLTVRAMPGYQTADQFNTPRSPDGSDDVTFYVFRNGVPIKDTGRLAVRMPSTATTVTVAPASGPWARQPNLAAIKPGDVLVYQARGGPHTFRFTSSQKSTVQNVSIFSAGGMAFSMPSASGMLIKSVQVIPRPGTDRLMSSNGDGIHASYAGASNTLTNNIVRRTGDDAFAFDAPWAAEVSVAADGTRVTVERFAGSTFPEGAPLAFIDPDTAAILGTAKIVSENPPSSQQTGRNGESVTVVLDKAVAGVKKGVGVVNTDPAMHGAASVMQYNLVQEGVFTRGLWLSGVSDINVHDNFFQRTSKPGIFIQQYNVKANSAGPSSNITIRNNVVDAAISYGNPSIGPIVAAASIRVGAENSEAAQVASSSHSNIVVTGNRITNSSRSAIRLDNVNGGRINNNDIQGFGQDPNTNVFLIPKCCQTEEEFVADFKRAVVVTNNVGVTRGNNRIDDNPLLTIASVANPSVPKVAPGSMAFASGTGLAATKTVTIIDSAGVTRTATVSSAGPNQVRFQVPDGVAVGIATVTIGMQAGGVLVDTVAPGLLGATATLHRQGGSLILTVDGTGMRGVSSLKNVVASINGRPAEIQSAGAHPSIPGLDQVNLVVPVALEGTAGEVPVIITVDGQTANVVTVRVGVSSSD